MATISLIIPLYNEGKLILALLERLKSIDVEEIILIDGGSTDNSTALLSGFAAQNSLRNFKILKIESPNRGGQLNFGASKAGGDILWFLHADCSFNSPDPAKSIKTTLRSKDIIGGCFSLATKNPKASYRAGVRVANWRSRNLKLSYGDQGIFVERTDF